MTDVGQAVAHAKNLGKQFRAVLEVAAVLEELGNLEQASRDAKELARQANEEAAVAIGKREQAQADLLVAMGHLTDVRDEATKTIALAKNEADGIIIDADVEAGKLVAIGRKQVDTLTIALDQAKAAHEDFMAGAADEAREIAEKIRVLREELAAIEKRITG